jgi:hypothetical protein
MFLALLASAIAAASLSRIYTINKEPLSRNWPIKNICPICNKRVWAWQASERRDATISLNNPGHLAVSARAIATVHKKCQGEPQIVLKVEKKAP